MKPEKSDKKRIRSLKALEKRIGYRFKNKALLEEALTHPSFRYENQQTNRDNQRLEFLGDSVLGFLAADLLMKQFPSASEGELTKRKTAVISGPSLAAAARQASIGDALRFGKGEAAGGGADRDSNLEDAFESILGAVWLDGGLKAAARFFERNLFSLTNTGAAKSVSGNPKGELQEQAAKSGLSVPSYRITEQTGPDHARCYSVEVTVGNHAFRGAGTSRRDAEKQAAAKALSAMFNSH